VDIVLKFIDAHVASFVWSLAAFVLFVVVIYRFGVKTVIAAVDAREKRIAGQLKESEEAFARARKVQAELDAKMKDAEHAIQGMMAEARRDAEAHKAAMIEQGRHDLDGMRTRALREIEAARHDAVVRLRREVADIAVLVAEKAAWLSLDPAKHEELVVQAIDAYEARCAPGQGA
jgi:F-type H+-transporting ATPase subunit b